MDAKPVRVGVVGVGHLGRFHALIYARLAEVILVGVADRDPARAAAVAAEAGCPVYSNAELLERVTAVSIAVPTTAHLEVAQPFLERGIHVLLEKPIAATVAEAAALIAAATRGGAMLQIGHSERFNAGVMALAARLGTPRYLEAQRLGGFVERATDVDVVTDLMIHDLDLILALVGTEPSAVRAIGTPVLTEHVDIASAWLEFPTGAVAHAVASRVSDKPLRRLRVFESGAYWSLDFIAQTLEAARPCAHPGAARPALVREPVAVTAVKPLDRELAAFVTSVKTGQPPLVDGRVGLMALRTALRVREQMGD